MAETWRLLDYSATNPRMDFAINEAIFVSRKEGLSRDTLRLWQGPRHVAIGANGSCAEAINVEACRRYGVQVVRAASVGNDVLYQDVGSINFAVAANTSSFTKSGESVLSAYEKINKCIARSLQKFNLDASADPHGVYVNGKKVSAALPKWFYDFLLFQGTILADTNLALYNKLIACTHVDKGKTGTILTHVAGQEMGTSKLKEAVSEAFEEVLNIKFEKAGLTTDEKTLSEKLYKKKYSVDKWNVDGRDLFLLGMGKTAVEVFVAYPPTSKCMELIKLVNQVTDDLKDEVRVVIWMRGKGLSQHGPNMAMSSGLANAHKASTIPAIIINGELVFRGCTPSKETLRETIARAID